MGAVNKVIGNILGKPVKDRYGKNNNSTLYYRRVHKDNEIGDCDMCGKKRKLVDDLCKECRSNK